MGYFDYTLDKNIPVPLYYQLKQTIISEIKNGNAKAGDMLPTEEQYCRNFGVSRTTARQAFSELVSEGWLHRVKGKGTFVTARVSPVQTNLTCLYTSFIKGTGDSDRQAKMLVRGIDIVPATQDVAMALGIKSGEQVIHVRRKQVVDGDNVISIIESYLRYPLCSQNLDADKYSHGSMYGILAENPQSEVGHIQRSIYAKNADADIATALGMKKGEAILQLVNQGYSKLSGDCVIVESVYYNGRKNLLVVDFDMDKLDY